MMVTRTKLFLIVSLAFITAAGIAYGKDPTPGFNLFSPQQDIQVGQEAAAQVEREQPVLRNSEVSNYLTGLVQRLARSPHAGTGFPFSVKAISSKDVNAFALPGGPLYVYTGLITMADNEGELAGVLAHEMSHIKLRHGTNQMTKANFLQLPGLLLAARSGNGGLAQLAQLGVGVGTQFSFLKMSRSAETDADYNGAQTMAEAGYDPIEMANMFRKLEAQGGQSSLQFLSDHPNPGNRVSAIQQEIQTMPRRSYTTDTRQFQRIRDIVTHLPAPGQLRGQYDDGHPAPSAPDSRPSRQMKQYQGRAFTISYPGNWQTYGDPQSATVTIAPSDGVVTIRNGTTAVGYGVVVSYYFPQSERIDLSADTQDLVRQMQQSDRNMRAGDQRIVNVNGFSAMVTSLTTASPFQGETEVDQLVTIARPQGLWYMILVAPQSETRDIQPVFDQMLRSVRFSN